MQSTTVPRTTAWRQGERTAAVAKLPCVRWQYTCTVCREPITSPGHSQFYGKRYCPNAPGQIPKEEWLAQRRAEKSEKSSLNQSITWPVVSSLLYIYEFEFPLHFDPLPFPPSFSPFPPFMEKNSPQLSRRTTTVTLAAHARRGLIKRISGVKVNKTNLPHDTQCQVGRDHCIYPAQLWAEMLTDSVVLYMMSKL